MEFFIFRYADSYSVVSNEFKKYFENKYNIKNKEIIVLPSSLDHNNFYWDAVTLTPEKLPDKLQYRNTKFIVQQLLKSFSTLTYE